jgi:hypothetical protein
MNSISFSIRRRMWSIFLAMEASMVSLGGLTAGLRARLSYLLKAAYTTSIATDTARLEKHSVHVMDAMGTGAFVVIVDILRAEVSIPSSAIFLSRSLAISLQRLVLT